MNYEEIYNVFKNTISADFKSIVFSALYANKNFHYKENFLFDHRVLEMTLQCNIWEKKELTIHPEAFASSRNLMEEFGISYCDLSQLKFRFLVGFNRLSKFYIMDSVNVHMLNFPSLPNLTELVITLCPTALSNWTNFPNLTNGLTFLNVQDNGLNNQMLDRVLEWILNGPSRNTLSYIDLSGNTLTRIPPQLRYFLRSKYYYQRLKRFKGKIVDDDI